MYILFCQHDSDGSISVDSLFFMLQLFRVVLCLVLVLSCSI